MLPFQPHLRVACFHNKHHSCPSHHISTQFHTCRGAEIGVWDVSASISRSFFCQGVVSNLACRTPDTYLCQESVKATLQHFIWKDLFSSFYDINLHWHGGDAYTKSKFQIVRSVDVQILNGNWKTGYMWSSDSGMLILQWAQKLRPSAVLWEGQPIRRKMA